MEAIVASIRAGVKLDDIDEQQYWIVADDDPLS